MEAGKGDTVAFYWEGNDEGDDLVWTFSMLKTEVCFALPSPHLPLLLFLKINLVLGVQIRQRAQVTWSAKGRPRGPLFANDR